jgi:hypothetical protein
MKHLYFLFLFIILQGCTSTTDYGSANESGIKLYHTGYSSISQRNNEAQAHCSRFQKKAVFVKSSAIPVYDEYRCE